MALTKLEKDMNIVQALDDEPNDVGGLTAPELKAKFDEGGVAVKEYLNDTLTPELDTALDGKAPTTRTVNGHPLSTDVTVTKADVGLKNADNTSDVEKPVSTAQQAALDLKANRTDVLEKTNTTAFAPSADYHPATKKYVDETTAAVVMGTLPDKSVTSDKLADGAVTVEKMASQFYANVSHTHPASDLSTVVPVTGGGTGAADAAGARENLGACADALEDATATALGLTGGSTVDDGLGRIVRSLAWVPISSYRSAGTYTWTAPDLYGDGQPYEIGVLVIGGGGSGGTIGTLATNKYDATGGASGYSESFIKTITPGTAYNVVVGAGGPSVTTTSNNKFQHSGNNGGTSSFAGITADGGSGAFTTSSGDTYLTTAPGGQPARETSGSAKFGGKIVGINQYSGTVANVDILSCFNPFTGERILGAGGGVHVQSDSGVPTYNSKATGGRNPATGLGGGHGALASGSGVVSAQSATDSGCGGGSVGHMIVTDTVTVISGKGGNGAVLIYARRGKQ